MGPAYRTGAGMMLCTFFAVALMILSILSYFFNSWFHLALITSLPFTILFGYWLVILSVTYHKSTTLLVGWVISADN